MQSDTRCLNRNTTLADIQRFCRAAPHDAEYTVGHATEEIARP
jgi:hypothetical protein